MNFSKTLIAVVALVTTAFSATQAQTTATATTLLPDDQLILVGGATGRTGFRIVQLLQQQGFRVRGMTRNRQRARETFGSDIEWFEADVRDP
ncbi:MAG: NAD(P)H-binding protein, partial [Gammaproteobacteria bacterium]|nr:NAD(P)H-binding protein [Gammaproteobacteria bacterium]